jgi:hypothetical protein
MAAHNEATEKAEGHDGMTDPKPGRTEAKLTRLLEGLLMFAAVPWPFLSTCNGQDKRPCRSWKNSTA